MIRLSDPAPPYCSGCGNSNPETRHVDFDSAHDGGSWQNTETLAYVNGSEDLHLCEACVRRGAEVLGLKPELHTRQLNEIRRLEIVVEHWQDRCKSLQQALNAALDAAPVEPRRPGRPRKTPAAV